MTFKNLIIGFAGVFFILFIFISFRLTSNNQENLQSTTVQKKQKTSDEPPLKLKNIGVNLDYYDPKTNKAGDFVFTKEKLQFERLFMGFGFVIPAEITSGGKAKSNPQPTFILPLKTPVRSLVDGVVAQMPTLWSGDISIQVTTDGKLQRWVYETEHVTNPKVKVGDKVKAGQIIAEVSNFDKSAPAGFGAVEIGILKGGQIPEHVCPFAYLDESIREGTFNKMIALFESWENYAGDQSLYSETIVPGCIAQDPIPG
ncbi:MAG: M23 family metallopeptidase [Patescibacteria group bacterium]